MDYEERQEVRNRRVNINCSIPMVLVEVIDRIVVAEHQSVSNIVERLIRKGLVVERAERAQKAGQ